MKKLMILVAAVTMAMVPATASAARFVVAGGPVFAPGFYGSYWGPAYGAYPSSAFGEVKFDTKSKDDQVFINGAFAGTTKEARTMHLRPGQYNIEVRQAGQPVLSEQVYVVAGKTLHLHPAL
jgi:hypothetical protein